MPKPHYWGGHPKSFSIAYKFISGKFKEKFIYSHDMKNLISEHKGNEIGFNKVFLYKHLIKMTHISINMMSVLMVYMKLDRKTVYFGVVRNFRDSKLDGSCEYFNKNGDLSVKNIWKNGKLVFHEIYGLDNKIIFKGNFVDDTSGKKKEYGKLSMMIIRLNLKGVI